MNDNVKSRIFIAVILYLVREQRIKQKNCALFYELSLQLVSTIGIQESKVMKLFEERFFYIRNFLYVFDNKMLQCQILTIRE